MGYAESSQRWARPRILAMFAAFLIAVIAAVIPTTPAAAESSDTNSAVRGTQTWYVWVAVGERLRVDFTENQELSTTSSDWGDTRIQIRNPQGSIVGSETFSFGGRVESYSYTYPDRATTAGVWAVELVPVGSPTDTLGQVSLSWNIRPVNRWGIASTGRVWSLEYRVKDQISNPFTFSLWYLTESGFVYQIERRRVVGIDSAFTADAFGTVFRKTCTSAYGSYDSVAISEASSYLKPASTHCSDITPYKIFFANPASDLPTEVTLPDGTTTWMKVDPPGPNDVQITGMEFTPKTPGARAGKFSFNLSNNYEGTARMRIDVDNDGVYDGAKDVETQVAVVGGVGSYSFDGLDANGTAIATTTPLSAQLLVERMGEVHFGDADVEILSGGIRVTRIGDSFGDVHRVYWNDNNSVNGVKYMTNTDKCSMTSALTSGENGVDSSGWVHGWGQGSCQTTNATRVDFFNLSPANAAALGNKLGGSYGNLRYIDRWTYVPLNVERLLEVPAFKLTKTSDPVSGTAVKPSGTVEYTVTTSPIRYSHLSDYNLTKKYPDIPATSWNGRYTDNLSDVLDNATLQPNDASAFTYQPSGTGVASLKVSLPTSYTWTGNAIPINSSATVKYQVKVNSAAELVGTDYELYNIAYVHTTSSQDPPETCERNLCGETNHPLGSLAVSKTSDPVSGTTVQPGEKVKYTVTIANAGSNAVAVDYTDHLADVLDDADFDITSLNVVPSTLSAAFDATAQTLTISGSLGADQTATITYTVTVREQGFGDAQLRNVVTETGEEPPTTCEPDDPLCTEHPVGSRYTMAKTSDPETGSVVSPGDTITYTVTAQNYANVVDRVVITDDLSDVLDDAAWVAGSATLVITDSSGDTVSTQPVADPAAGETTLVTQPFTLPVEGKAVLTYQVTVNADAWLTTLKNLVWGTTDPEDPQETPQLPEECTPDEPCQTVHTTNPGLLIQKTGENSSGQWVPMDGSQWQLNYDNDGSLGAVVSDPTPTALVEGGSVVTGWFQVLGLTPGVYWLTETTAPDGFNLLAEPLRFELKTNGEVQLLSSGQDDVVSLTQAGTDSPATITVRDVPAMELPEAGGAGMLPFLVGGSLLFGLAIAVAYTGRFRSHPMPG